MRFALVPLEEAIGHILGHNVAGADGRRVLRKGRVLTNGDVEVLGEIGRTHIHVAILDPDDIDENQAAHTIATTIKGDHIRLSGATTGRVNLYANLLGVVRIDQTRLLQLNRLDGVTLATLPTNMPVRAGKMVATLKIIPYAIPDAIVKATQAIGTIVTLSPLAPKTVTMILSGFPTAADRIVRSFDNALRPRIEALGSTLNQIDFVSLEDEHGEQRLASAIEQHKSNGSELIILAGETAIMDRHDITPCAVERAGGEIIAFGAPVDPGNLLMVGQVGDTPILGAPGCARSPKDNIVDLMLPRLLAGDKLTHDDIVALGHGGLLEDVPERPLPRSRLE